MGRAGKSLRETLLFFVFTTLFKYSVYLRYCDTAHWHIAFHCTIPSSRTGLGILFLSFMVTICLRHLQVTTSREDASPNSVHNHWQHNYIFPLENCEKALTNIQRFSKVYALKMRIANYNVHSRIVTWEIFVENIMFIYVKKTKHVFNCYLWRKNWGKILSGSTSNKNRSLGNGFKVCVLSHCHICSQFISKHRFTKDLMYFAVTLSHLFKVYSMDTLWIDLKYFRWKIC